jgi:hypothetical protein
MVNGEKHEEIRDLLKIHFSGLIPEDKHPF